MICSGSFDKRRFASKSAGKKFVARQLRQKNSATGVKFKKCNMLSFLIYLNPLKKERERVFHDLLLASLSSGSYYKTTAPLYCNSLQCKPYLACRGGHSIVNSILASHPAVPGSHPAFSNFFQRKF